MKSSLPAQGRSPTPPTLRYRGLTCQVTLPDAKQLRLSEDAALHMRRIVDEFSYATNDNNSRGSTKQRLHQLLFDFFDTFGSHVFRRPACGAAYRTARAQLSHMPLYPLVKGRRLLYTHCRLRKAHIAQWRERHRAATVLLPTFQSLAYRRANLLRRPPPCARRDGQPRVHVRLYRARGSRIGDLQELHRNHIERLLRRGEFYRSLHTHDYA